MPIRRPIEYLLENLEFAVLDNEDGRVINRIANSVKGKLAQNGIKLLCLRQCATNSR